ncbi:DUF4304 domain-containing protein [Paenibacillus glycanilyticus]|uniref:DUF4304 domain-containing protein n=1 Tax=Paenibacillus glycanilyticus TaxID=126569 RepID=UPI0020400D3B|nr:DUF4304 domain-containing protein [Paenibacillus glycanilyticus]MCM3626247.1 DUF4304 domain-containing protein [Paenibacillus glycanilyticus]
MTPKEMFKRMLTEDIAPLFKVRGYRKKNATFVRESKEVIQIINFRASSYNLPDYYTFSIEIALFSESYFSALNLNKPTSWFSYQSYRPIIETSLMYLNHKKEGTHFPDCHITESTEISALSEKIKSKLETLVFPYVENINSTNDIIVEIERQVSEEDTGTRVAQYDLIPLYCIIGNRSKAEEALVYAWNRKISNPHYTKLLKDFTQKLGLSVLPD